MSDTPPPPPPTNTFPIIETGGSLLLAWQLSGRRVLIVGGGEVASGRLRNVLEADALVTLIAPSRSLHPEVRYRIFNDPSTRSRITYHDRIFNLPPPPSTTTTSNDTILPTDQEVEDLDNIDMVLTAIDDVDISRQIWALSRARRIPTNVADIPPNCDFYFGSQIRSGPLQIMVSTNGKGPKIANIIRRRIESTLPPEIGTTIVKVGQLRERLRDRAPGVGGAVGRKRMKWMIGVCEQWSLEELGELDDRMMEKLLNEGWEKGGQVPSFSIIGGPRVAGKDWIRRVKSFATFERTADILVGATLGVAITTLIFKLQR